MSYEIKWEGGPWLKEKWDIMCAKRKEKGWKTDQMYDYMAQAAYKLVGGSLADVVVKHCSFSSQVLLGPRETPTKPHVLVAVAIRPPKCLYLGWISAEELAEIGPIKFLPRGNKLHRPVFPDQLHDGLPDGSELELGQAWFESLPEPGQKLLNLEEDDRPLIGVTYPDKT